MLDISLLLATFLAFILGALPFSVWVGKALLNVDIRQFGDGNPGATNVLRAGSKAGYLLAVALDVSKGAIPAGLARNHYHLSGWPLVLICMAPVLGHAFSPFLHWSGGKALATSSGVWFALGIPYFIAAVVAIVIWSLLVEPSGYAVALTMLTMLLLLYLRDPGWTYTVIWLFQALIFLLKWRDDFRQRPRFRPKSSSSKHT